MSIVRKHKSPKTGKMEICHAEKRACRYGADAHTTVNTNDFGYRNERGEVVSKEVMKETIEKLGAAGKLDDYFRLRTRYEELSKKNAIFEDVLKTTQPVKPELKQNFNPLTITPSMLKEPQEIVPAWDFDTHYDSFDAPNGFQKEYDPSTWVYKGLRLEGTPEVRNTLSHVFQCRPYDVPEELVEYAKKELRMRTPEAYTIGVRNGYYGEEIEIRLKPEVLKSLQTWYKRQPNSVDSLGVLDYVRSKGINTATRAPLEALKMQLLIENSDRVNPVVQTATEISRRQLSFDEIHIPNKEYFNRVKPRKIVSGNKTADKIAGVVYEQNGKYVLVDGYHRMKGITNKEKLENFIVLS